MADSLPASQEPVRQKPVGQEPAGGFSFKQMLPTLVFDVAMPIVAFNVLTGYGVSKLWALAAGGLFPAINNIRAWTKSRRLEPLGIIVMAFLAIGTATSLISGSVFFALIKESFLTATFGVICLGSLLFELISPLRMKLQQFLCGIGRTIDRNTPAHRPALFLNHRFPPDRKLKPTLARSVCDATDTQ